MKHKQKILILHYRVGKTDGVSIEINHWKQILEKQGHIVKLASGPVNEGADFVIKKLEQQLDPEIYAIDEQVFGGEKAFSDNELTAKISEIRNSISHEFEEIIKTFNPDRIIFSNIFCVGEHISAPKAFLQVLDKYQIPTLLVNHDFYWENIRYKVPVYDFISQTLEEDFIPDRSYITHSVINSIAQEEVKVRRGLKAEVIYDTLDFNQPAWKVDDYNSDILSNWKIKRNDIVVLQATRIVRRKNIELAIDLVKKLQSLFDDSAHSKIKLYKNHLYFCESSKVYLVLAGYAEKRDMQYFKELMHYAALNKINLCYIGDSISGSRREDGEGKVYSLWDAYARSDLITYPSEYEGFGNQFLEAVFAKKPVVTFEYPVFKTDIKDKGFDYISLGDSLVDSPEGLSRVDFNIIDRAADEAFKILTEPKLYKKTVDGNFDIARRNFSFEATGEILKKLLQL